MYNIYDDSFNNLESIKNQKLKSFFKFYEPTDKTLKEGEVTFFMMEKMKNQKVILESQLQSLILFLIFRHRCKK